jgi:hypothetical protein
MGPKITKTLRTMVSNVVQQAKKQEAQAETGKSFHGVGGVVGDAYENVKGFGLGAPWKDAGHFQKIAASLKAKPEDVLRDLLQGYDPGSSDADEIAERIANDPDLLAALTKEQRLMLIRGLFDGSTGEGEEDAAMRLLTEGTGPDELKWLVDRIGWDELDDELDGHDLDAISKGLTKVPAGKNSIEGILAQFGIKNVEDMDASKVRDLIKKKLAEMSGQQKADLAKKLLDGRKDILDEFTNLRRIGLLSTSKSQAMQTILNELAKGAPQQIKSDLVRFSHRIAYTERIAGNLEEGDYGELINLIPRLFDPKLGADERWAIYETLKELEPELRAMEDVVRDRGNPTQKTRLRRFMNLYDQSMEQFFKSGGKIPEVDVLNEILKAAQAPINKAIETVEDFQDILGFAFDDVKNELNGLVDRLLNTVEDDEARELVGNLDAKGLLAYIPFDVKHDLIMKMVDGFTGDEDERAILDILRETKKNNPAEFYRLVDAVGFGTLDDNIHGDEWDEFMRLMNEDLQ